MDERKCPFCLNEMVINDDLYECSKCDVTFSEDEIHYIA
jgi:ribosomal protein L37AE/L43A